MDEEYKKVVRDPLYGYIGLTEEQLEVIRLPVFQRLRRISQLSFADLVYPNATHTRFAHSLGVGELARRSIQYLKSIKVDIDESYFEALIWAGFLHDIGHFPFSHVFEPIGTEFIEKEGKSWRDFNGRWSKKIIDDPRYGISKIIKDDIREKVLSLIDKDDKSSPKILRDIMTWFFSIDRLDYLRRDAYHAGTPEYAIIDTDRVISSQIPYDDESISVYKRKALYVLEGAILSYFYMYRAIYYHHTVRAAYLLFQDILWDAFEKYNIFEGIDWQDHNFWINFDDHRCIAMLAKNEKLSEKLTLLLTRQLPKIIKEKELVDPNIRRVYRLCQEGSYKEKIQSERRLLKKLKTKWPSLKLLFLDSPILVPYPPTPFAIDYPYIWNGDTHLKPTPFHKEAVFVKYLAEASEKARVYVDRVWTSRDEKQKFIEGLNDEIQQLLKKILNKKEVKNEVAN